MGRKITETSEKVFLWLTRKSRGICIMQMPF